MSLSPQIIQIFQHYTYGHIRPALFGGGLAYAITSGYWHHTPLVLLNPVAYAAYQIFTSQARIIDWYKQTLIR